MVRTASITLAFAAFLVLPAAAQAPTSDPTAAILAAHRAADEAYAKAPMSPFTAVAVHYLTPGQSVRLAAGSSGVDFGADIPSEQVVEFALDEGGFLVAPVKGAPPAIAKTSGEGDVSGLPGTAATAKTRLARHDVVRVGRFLVETIVQGSLGNARVFDPDAPARKAFSGLKWFPPNLALQVKARFVPNAAATAVTITTSRGLQKDYYRVGVFEFTVEGRPLKLTALATGAVPAAGDELFVAFRDATTGKDSYEVGRYLFIPFTSASAEYLLDFNQATNPLCNYSPHYNCPIPPRENVLPVAIRAGEMKYPKEH